MKLLHIADLHLGKRVNGFPMLDDQRHILAQVVSIARDRAVDAVVIAGDIYDKASPSAEAVSMLDVFLTELVDAGVTTIAVPGNHDSAERIAYASQMLAAQGVWIAPTFEGSVDHGTLEDEHGPVTFWLLPFLKPGDVRRFHPDEELGDDYTRAMRAVLSSCDVNPNERNVLIAHQFVTAGSAETDRADEEIKLGGIDNVDVTAFDAFDYVALGHVHRPQRIGRDTVRYAGSPLKYSFSEARYQKSATLVELGPKHSGDEVGSCVQFELLPLEPLHDMRELSMPLEELLASAPEGEAANDYLHVTLTDEHPQLDAMQKVREAYPNVMMVDYDNRTLRTSRETTRAAVDPNEMSTIELFAQFYEEQAGTPLDEAQIDTVSTIDREIREREARGDAHSKGSRS